MNELDQLKPILEALLRVQAPDIPLDVDFREIRSLLDWLDAHPDVSATLEDVGLEPTVLPALRVALPAAVQAQDGWATSRNPRRPEDQSAIEEQGRRLRSAAIAACRLALRADRRVQKTLDRILESDGMADLVQDLETLARLVETHVAALSDDLGFDAPSQPAKLRAAAQAVRHGLAGYRISPAQKEAVDLRNRAWTWLSALVAEVREAGSHACRDTSTARAFTSAWERRSPGVHRRTRFDTLEPEDSVDGPPFSRPPDHRDDAPPA